MRVMRKIMAFLFLSALAFGQSGPFAASGGNQSLFLNVSGGIAAVGTVPTNILPITLLLAPSTTNYVYVDLTAGTIASNTSGFTSTTYPVAIAVTSTTLVTSLTDRRPGAWNVTGLSTGATGTVTSVSPGTGMSSSPNPITVSGSLSIASTGVGAGSYTCPTVTINLQGQVTAAANGSCGGNVSSVFGRTGAVTAASNDYAVSQVTGAAPIASPTFTGVPTAPTPTTVDNSTKIATTAWVVAQGYGTGSGAVSSVFGRSGVVTATSGDYTVGQVTGAAPLASPSFTGNPTSTTPATADNSTKIATTAWTNLQSYGVTTNRIDQNNAATTSTQFFSVISDETGTGSVVGSASPTFTGVPLAPTAANGTNTTQIATTAFVIANGGGGGSLPLTTLGDTVYEDATPTPARLPGNTSATMGGYTQTGNGTISAAPAWTLYGGGGTTPVAATFTSPAQGQTLVENSTPVLVNAYPGVPVNTKTGDYTFACPGDRLGEIEFTISSAHTLSMPQAGATACTGSNMALVVTNASSSTALLTISATTSTFQPAGGTSTTVLPGGSVFIYSDATSSTGNYHTVSVPTSFGGINAQTTSYTMTQLDKDRVVVMNCSTSCTVTLPATPPSSKWNAGILSIGSTKATVSLNSLTFNGSASVPVLISDMIMPVITDGTNYFGSAPLVAGTNVTLTAATNGVTIAASGGGGGVTSVTGDGTLVNNSASTGVVTLTQAPFAAFTSYANNTNGSAVPTAQPYDCINRYHPIAGTGDQLSAAGTFATTASVGTNCLAAGTLLTVRAHGVYTTGATATPKISFQVNAGGTSGICPAPPGATANTNITSGYWDLICNIQINTTGSPGTAVSWGNFSFDIANGSVSSYSVGAFANASTGTVSYTTGTAQTVSIQETGTSVSGQTYNLTALDITVAQ